MDLTCPRCQHPVLDVSDEYLAEVRAHRAWTISAIFFCSRTCDLAHVQVGEDLWPIARRRITELSAR